MQRLPEINSCIGGLLQNEQGSGETVLTAPTLVLVVAPDKDFRHSLEFALEVEGFSVDCHVSMSRAFASARAEQAGCAVVDDVAIGIWSVAEEEFRSFGRPVVLLTGRTLPMPRLPLTTVLAKPFLGTPLGQTIREVVLADTHGRLRTTP